MKVYASKIDYNIEDGVVEVRFSNLYIFCQIGIDAIRSHTDTTMFWLLTQKRTSKNVF